VNRSLRRFLSPRAYKAGAFYVGTPARTKISFLTAALVAVPFALRAAVFSAAFIPSAAVAQIPGIAGPPPDTVLAGADSTGRVPGLAEADSSTILADSSTILADSSAILADSGRVAPKGLPVISFGPGPSYGLAVWSWDRGALLSTRAVTLAELVALIPGVIALKGGDYGTPVTVISSGAGGGRVRVLWDGFEWVPLNGGVPDLSRIGLAGLDEVRVERHPGELRIELRTMEPTAPDPATLVHVGTGDLGTNLLSGVFVHPNVYRGAFTLAFDRLETRGPGLAAGGTLSGVALRYSISRGDRGGIVAEMRRFAPRTDVAGLVTGLTRNDWNVRARWHLAEGLIGEGYWGASSLAGGPEDPVYGGLDTRRTQLGLRTKYTIGNLWAQGTARRFSGHGVPGANYELAAGGTRGSVASLDGSLRIERWDGRYATSWRARIETVPLRGFSLFASYEDGETGAPFVSEYEAYLRSLRLGPPTQPGPIEEPRPRFTNRTGIRAGGRLSWRGLNLSGAWLWMEADSLRPLGLALDPDGISSPGGDRIGFEATASIPIPFPMSGFVLQGTVQAWDDDLAYLPMRLWDGALTYHGIFKESRNLELWGGLGMTRRDPMPIGILESGGDPTVPDLIVVPRSEEWYIHVQVRIVTLNLFVRWENVRRKADNIDFPDRRQPQARTLYGVRWLLNN
jgi:hypothetical protein